jgi:hypothetical protein
VLAVAAAAEVWLSIGSCEISVASQTCGANGFSAGVPEDAADPVHQNILTKTAGEWDQLERGICLSRPLTGLGGRANEMVG